MRARAGATLIEATGAGNDGIPRWARGAGVGPFVALCTDMTYLDLRDARAVAAHVVLTLARAQSRGIARTIRLDELAARVGVRKDDVRAVVSRLHAEGHVDATRMRVTMSGLAIASSLRGCKLRDPRASATATASAARAAESA